MGAMASQITSLAIVYSTVYSGADQRKHQSSASPAFVRGIHQWPVNSPHKWPLMRKMFPFDDVIMNTTLCNEIVSNVTRRGVTWPTHTRTYIYNINIIITENRCFDVNDYLITNLLPRELAGNEHAHT